MLLVYILSSELSWVLRITSSRQSPRMSADKHGLLLEPLLKEHSSLNDFIETHSFEVYMYLLILPLSSISRKRSPSHQTQLLIGIFVFSAISILFFIRHVNMVSRD